MDHTPATGDTQDDGQRVADRGHSPSPPAAGRGLPTHVRLFDEEIRRILSCSSPEELAAKHAQFTRQRDTNTALAHWFETLVILTEERLRRLGARQGFSVGRMRRLGRAVRLLISGRAPTTGAKR